MPEAAVEDDTVKPVNAVEPGEAHTAMADEMTATETANGEPMTTETTTAETMAATAVTTAVATTTAGVGDLGQRDDDGNEHCIHQIEQLTTHDTLLLQAFFSHLHERARIMAKLRQRRSYLLQ